jgi:putative spermidine/putrescine transport system permease protein
VGEHAVTRGPGAAGLMLRLHAGIVILFLLAPIAIAIACAFTSGDFLEFPPRGMSLRWFGEALRTTQFIDGLWNSILVALANAVIATVAGTGAAIALNHYRFRGRSLIQAAIMLPITLPAIVLGLGLLFTLPSYGMRPGLVAGVLGHAVLSLPYATAMVLAALANYDRSLERASLNLGAGPARTFLKITLPLIRGGIAAGAITAFLVSFDNISMSLFVTKGDTLPLRLLQQIQHNADPSVAAMSTMLLVGSLGLVIVLLPLAARVRDRPVV